ncbi:MAG: hypothetical protein NT175_02480 [Bacteroidetes bacterium]|nr:hypothetical protein [Bacteroidota bacterium]
MELLTQRYQDKISFELGYYDRLILTGTLPELSYEQGMTAYLNRNGIRIFDYARFAEPFKEMIKENANRKAAEQSVNIEFIRKAATRKEQIIADKIKQRGIHPGVVHIISTMELCHTYQPWHDKSSGRTFLKPDQSKCLH